MGLKLRTMNLVYCSMLRANGINPMEPGLLLTLQAPLKWESPTSFACKAILYR